LQAAPMAGFSGASAWTWMICIEVDGNAGAFCGGGADFGAPN
jgi:hypothetical protein